MANTVHRHDPEPCAPCDIGPFARNNYFTGKLLLERDFTDEQTLLRRQAPPPQPAAARLGRRLRPEGHAAPDPGMPRPLRVHRARHGDRLLRPRDRRARAGVHRHHHASRRSRRSTPDADSRTRLQICLRYRECRTEPIPVLYDDCGCDDTRCLPNRILESYDVDVDRRPAGHRATRGTARSWSAGIDIGFAGATRVIASPTDGRAVRARGNDGARGRPRARARSCAPTTWDRRCTASSCHRAARICTRSATKDGGGFTLTVLVASDFSVHHEDDAPGVAAPVVTAVSPAADGRFLVLAGGAASLLVYGSDLEGATPAAPSTITVPADRSLLSIARDGTVAYVAGTTAVAAGDPAPLESVDLTSATVDAAVGIAPARCAADRARDRHRRHARRGDRGGRGRSAVHGRPAPRRRCSAPCRWPAPPPISSAVRGCTRWRRPEVPAGSRR